MDSIEITARAAQGARHPQRLLDASGEQHVLRPGGIEVCFTVDETGLTKLLELVRRRVLDVTIKTPAGLFSCCHGAAVRWFYGIHPSGKEHGLREDFSPAEWAALGARKGYFTASAEDVEHEPVLPEPEGEPTDGGPAPLDNDDLGVPEPEAADLTGDEAPVVLDSDDVALLLDAVASVTEMSKLKAACKVFSPELSPGSSKAGAASRLSAAIDGSDPGPYVFDTAELLSALGVS